MEFNLIKLENKFILVSDEGINEGDRIIRLSNLEQSIANDEWDNDTHDDWRKIVAGIPDLPSIDFSSLSEEDCKKIGWVDVEKLALKYVISIYSLRKVSIHIYKNRP